jgi:hypothetical protein
VACPLAGDWADTSGNRGNGVGVDVGASFFGIAFVAVEWCKEMTEWLSASCAVSPAEYAENDTMLVKNANVLIINPAIATFLR